MPWPLNSAGPGGLEGMVRGHQPQRNGATLFAGQHDDPIRLENEAHIEELNEEIAALLESLHCDQRVGVQIAHVPLLTYP